MNESSAVNEPSQPQVIQPILVHVEPDALLPTIEDLDDLNAQLDSIDRTLADLDQT